MKKVVFYIFLAAVFMLPLSTFAQKNDNWFKGSSDESLNRANVEWSDGIGNQGFNQNAPLGSGLAMLFAAGAGYAVMKSRKSRKKYGMMMMALVMMLGLTQCKKNVPTINNVSPVLEGETYHITLTLNNGGGDAKHEVIPDGTVAPVKFVAGDKIFVAYNGLYAGVLTCTGESETNDPVNDFKLGKFEGDITLAQVGDQPLHFYFLGNKTTNSGLSYVYQEGKTIGFEVNITDQTTSLPVISYAPSKENFPSASGKYTVRGNWMLNQCALVKFNSVNIYENTTNSVDNNEDALYKTDKQITIKGVNNFVSINFAKAGQEGHFNPSMINGGEVKLNNTVKESSTEGNEVRYAIVFAGDYSDEGDLDVAFDYVNDRYGFTGTYNIGKSIENNDYCNDAELRLVWHSGAFTIGSGEYVVFSRGNLQYNAYRDTWRFAKHQYDYVGGLTNNVHQGNVVKDETTNNITEMSDNENIASDYNGWIDLFGWGTAGNPTKHGDPLQSGNAASTYKWTKDWGTNYISNSGLTNSSANEDYWVTMTKQEWPALFNVLVADGRIGYATVNGIHGIVFVPDNFANGGTYTTQSNTWTPMYDYVLTVNPINFSQNVFDVAGWNTMEQFGAVFLPASGYRDVGNDNTDFDSGVGSTDNQDGAFYWSSSASAGQPNTQACYFGWGDGISGPTLTGPNYHLEYDGDRMNYYGCSVRFVHRIMVSK